MKTPLARHMALAATALLLFASGCAAQVSGPGAPDVPQARLAFAPLLIIFLFVAGLIGGSVAFAAIRKGGAAVGMVFALLVVGAVFLTTFLGYASVRTSAVSQPAPPVVVYAETMPPIPPAPVIPYPNIPATPLPAGPGMTRILTPEEVPAGTTTLPPSRAPVEAVRPSAGAPVATAAGTPQWLKVGTVQEGDRTFIVVSGQQFADAATAWQDAINRAAATVRQDFENAFRPVGAWLLDPNEARALAVRDSYTEQIVRTAGENEFTVYRTHLKVELSPTVRHSIEPIWRQQVSTGRSAFTAGMLGLVTLVAAIFAGYFRLDDRTAGRYRWRLRLGSVAAIALAGAVVLAGVATFPVRTVTAPAVSNPIPIEQSAPVEVEQPMAASGAPTSQPEACFVNRDPQRFSNVADHMVEAINAADYGGLRRDFNDTMLDAFPEDRCRTFFNSEVSRRFGRINTLEPPKFESPAMAAFVARCDRGTLDFTPTMDEQGQVSGMLFRPRPGNTPW